MLTSTLPKTPAEAAVLKRAKLLTDIRWTPITDVPAYMKRENLHTVIPAGVETTGLPYSSTEAIDKFVPENVSLESFLSALSNPHSKIYQPGHGRFGRANYGIVCNSFVRYTLGIPYRVPTALWLTLPGMRKVADAETYSAEDICLCDVLYAFGNGRHHVAMITDILRDETGAIAEIEVSEAVSPRCKRVRYPVEQYFELYRLFSLCRYDFLDEVPPFDEEEERICKSGIDKVLPKITVDNGNHSNYLVGQEVVLSVFSEEDDTVELLKDGTLCREILTKGRAFMPLNLERGYYVARLKNEGSSVEFAMLAANISHKVEGDEITITADPCDAQSTIVYADFRKAGQAGAPMAKFEILTEDEVKTGVITRKIPSEAANYKVYFKNPYGVWTHPLTKI